MVEFSELEFLNPDVDLAAASVGKGRYRFCKLGRSNPGAFQVDEVRLYGRQDLARIFGANV